MGGRGVEGGGRDQKEEDSKPTHASVSIALSLTQEVLSFTFAISS